MANKKNRDPIPEHFKSIEDAAEFWDNHDLGDYWDLTREAHFDVDIKRRVFLTALEPQLAKKIDQRCATTRCFNRNVDQCLVD